MITPLSSRSINNYTQKSSNSITFTSASTNKYPTDKTIERDKRIKRNNTITMLGGASIGIATGCLKFANKLKAGIIGGVIGLVAGKLIGFLVNPRIYKD